jgi:hypothetical protein
VSQRGRSPASCDKCPCVCAFVCVPAANGVDAWRTRCPCDELTRGPVTAVSGVVTVLAWLNDAVAARGPPGGIAHALDGVHVRADLGRVGGREGEELVGSGRVRHDARRAATHATTVSHAATVTRSNTSLRRITHASCPCKARHVPSIQVRYLKVWYALRLWPISCAAVSHVPVVAFTRGWYRPLGKQLLLGVQRV